MSINSSSTGFNPEADPSMNSIPPSVSVPEAVIPQPQPSRWQSEHGGVSMDVLTLGGLGAAAAALGGLRYAVRRFRSTTEPELQGRAALHREPARSVLGEPIDSPGTYIKPIGSTTSDQLPDPDFRPTSLLQRHKASKADYKVRGNMRRAVAARNAELILDDGLRPRNNAEDERPDAPRHRIEIGSDEFKQRNGIEIHPPVMGGVVDIAPGVHPDIPTRRLSRFERNSIKGLAKIHTTNREKIDRTMGKVQAAAAGEDLTGRYYDRRIEQARRRAQENPQPAPQSQPGDRGYDPNWEPDPADFDRDWDDFED